MPKPIRTGKIFPRILFLGIFLLCWVGAFGRVALGSVSRMTGIQALASQPLLQFNPLSSLSRLLLGQDAQQNDAIGREISIFRPETLILVEPTDAIGREISISRPLSGSFVVQTDAIGREISIARPFTALIVPQTDAIGREFTLYRPATLIVSPQSDAISREVSVFEQSGFISGFPDAISREVSVFEQSGFISGFPDAISREVSVFEQSGFISGFPDAISREVSVFAAFLPPLPVEFFSVNTTDRTLLRHSPTGVGTVIGPLNSTVTVSELAFLGNRLLFYGFEGTTNYFGEINPETGALTILGTPRFNGNPIPRIKALSVRGNTVYVGFSVGNNTANRWGTLDLVSQSVTEVGQSSGADIEFEGAASSESTHFAVNITEPPATGFNEFYLGDPVPNQIQGSFSRGTFGTWADLEFVDGRLFVRGLNTDKIYTAGQGPFGLEVVDSLTVDGPTNVGGFAARVALPNLKALNLAANPTSVSAGSQVNVVATGLNSGTVAAVAPWTDKLYLSRDTLIGDDVEVGSTTITQNLAPGAAFSRPYQIVIPSGYATSTGTYYLLHIADQSSSVAETNETDNGAAIPITISVETRPDLVAEPLAGPVATAVSGLNTTLTGSVRNAGPGTVNQPFRVKLIALVGGGPEIVLDDQTVNEPLSPGETVNVPFLTDFNNLTGAVDWILRVQVDSESEISERDETNNIFTASWSTRVLVADSPNWIESSTGEDVAVNANGTDVIEAKGSFVILRDATSGNPEVYYPGDGSPVHKVLWLSNTDFVYGTYNGGIFKATAGQPGAREMWSGHGDRVTGLALSSDRAAVHVSGTLRFISTFDLNGVLIRKLDVTEGSNTGIAANSGRLAVVRNNGLISLFDEVTGIPAGTASGRGVAAFEADRFVVADSAVGLNEVRVIDRNGAIVGASPQLPGTNGTLAVSPTRILAGSTSRVGYLLRSNDLSLVTSPSVTSELVPPGTPGAITGLSFQGDNAWITTQRHGSFRVTTSGISNRREVHGPVRDLNLSDDGGFLATVSAEGPSATTGYIRIWRAVDGVLQSQRSTSLPASAVTFLAGSSTRVIFGQGARFGRMNASSGQNLGSVNTQGTVLDIETDAQSRPLILIEGGTVVRHPDDFSSTVNRTWSVPGGEVLAISPNRRWLAVLNPGATSALSVIHTESEVQTNIAIPGGAVACDISPDGTQVAVAYSDGSIRLVNVALATVVQTFPAKFGLPNLKSLTWSAPTQFYAGGQTTSGALRVIDPTRGIDELYYSGTDLRQLVSAANGRIAFLDGEFTIGTVDGASAPPDNEAPDTEITTPPNNSFRKNPVRFEWTGSDNQTATGSLRYEYRTTGNWIPTNNTSVELSLPEGAASFEVRAIDTADNVDPTPARVNLVVDNTPPTFSNVALDISPYPTIRVSFTTSEPADGSLQIIGGNTVVGTSQQVNHVINVSGLATGRSYQFILIAVDRAGNEAQFTTAEIFLPDPADLSVNTLVAPAEAEIGREYELRWTTVNLGSQTLPATKAEIRISPNADGSAGVVVKTVDLAAITGGQSRVDSTTVTVPSGINFATGQWVIDVDSAGQITESNENNNRARAAVTILSPDLLPSSLVSASARTGVSNVLEWRIANEGRGGAAAGHSTRVAISSFADGANATTLGNLSVNTRMEPGATLVQSLEVTLPANLVPGTAYLVLTTDAQGSISESSESNNTRIFPITIAGPDLQPADVVAPAKVKTRQSFNIQFKDLNTGPGKTAQSWITQVSFSPNADGSGPTLIRRLNSAGALDTGQSQAYSFSFSFPRETAPGRYYLVFLTDEFNFVPEGAAESNNRLIVPIDVELEPTADLVVPSVSVPAQVSTNAEFDIRWTVRNQGQLSANPSADRISISRFPSGEGATTLGTFFYSVTLAAGNSADRGQVLRIPLDLIPESGTYYLTVTADATNLVDEVQSEQNNSRTVPIQIIRQPLPDLVVTQIQAPASTKWGSIIEVQWRVENLGAFSTETDEWFDFIYLSQDQTIGSDDVKLGTVNLTYLDPTEGYVNRTLVQIPRGLTGTYNLLVQADGDLANVRNRVAEANEENNVLSRPITLTQAEYPDLVTDLVRIPDQAFADLNFPLSYQIGNQGTSPVPPNERFWTETVFLSRDTVLDAQDLAIASRARSGNLQPGQTESVNLEPRIPRTATGEYYVIVLTDSNNNVFEYTQEANNWAVSRDSFGPKKFNILSTPPDLKGISITGPTTAKSATNISVSWTVENDSAFTASGSWSDGIYLSSDPTLSPEDRLLSATEINGPLEGGSPYTKSLSVLLPTCESGRYYLFARADLYDSVLESDPNNNVTPAFAIDISANEANLIARTASGPSTGRAGSPISVSYRVENVGPGPTQNSTWTDGFYLSRTQSLAGAQRIASLGHSGRMQPNTSYSNSTSIQLPSSAGGDYFLIFATDIFNQEDECGKESDNVFVIGPIRVEGRPDDDQRPKPDLVMAAFAGTTQLTVGEPFRLPFTLRNDGPDAITLGNWIDRLLISTDDQPSLDDRPLAQIGRSASLAVGATLDDEFRGSVPTNLAPGNYHLIAVGDAFDYVFEDGRETNNFAARAITITPPQADLQVTEIDFPDEVTGGQSAPLVFTVQNKGTQMTFAEGWRDRVYLSKDLDLDSSDTLLSEIPRTGSLAPQGSYTFSQSVAIPTNLSGRYFLIIATDASNLVPEANETNNLGVNSRTTLILPPPPVDLTVKRVEPLPAAASLGETTTFSWVIRNAETRAITGTWVDTVYLSKDDRWDIDDVVVGRKEREGGLGGSEEYTGTLQADIPAVEPGAYYVIVRTDARNRVRERNESNNIGASAEARPVTITTLTLGQWFDSSLRQSQSKFFRAETPAGESVRWDLDGSQADDWNDLFVRRSELATAANFEYSGLPFFSDQSVVVPQTLEGFLYAMARGTFVTGGGPAPMRIKAEVIPFSITDFGPKEAGSTGQVTLTLSGGRFRPGARVELRGPTTLRSDRVTVLDPSLAKARFLLDRAQLGNYSVVLINPDSSETTAPEPLKLVQATAPLGCVTARTIDPPSVFRIDNIGLAIRNLGNVDVPYTVVAIGAGQGLEMTFNLDDRVLPRRSQFPGLDLGVVNPLSEKFGSTNVGHVVLRDLEVGELVNLPVTTRGYTADPYPVVTVLYSGTRAEAAQRAAYSAELIRQRMVLENRVPAFLSSVASSPAAFWTSVRETLVAQGYFEAEDLASVPVGGAGSWLTTFEGDRVNEYLSRWLPAAVDRLQGGLAWVGPEVMGTVFEWALRGLSDRYEEPIGKFSNVDQLTQRFGQLQPARCTFVLERRPAAPFDPNDKQKPGRKKGTGLTGATEPWTYRINFENLPSAAGAASRVVIEDQLEGSLDPRTVRLSAISFGDTTINLPSNTAFFTRRVQLPASQGNLLADVTAFVDTARGLIRWDIQAIDPQTGEPPNSSLLGLLQPENGSGRGQGYVVFSVRPRAGVGTGTIIGNQASIVFDNQPPIVTPRVTSGVDANRPVSLIAPLPPTTGSSSFAVSWSGSDDSGGSGVDTFDIYVSEDGGPFTVWIQGTDETSATFQGKVGKSYGFFSVASDESGNVERLKTQPDTTTFVGNLPAPRIRAMTPSTVAPGSGPVVLRISGQNFVEGSVVTLDGTEIATSIQSTGELRATVPASLLTTQRQARVRVKRGSLLSNEVRLVIGVPILNSTQTAVRNGDGSVEVTLNLKNDGTAAATGVSITSASLAGINTSTGLPLAVTNIQVGQTVTVKLRFPDPGPGGRAVQLRFGGTMSGANFSRAVRITLP